jgi:hypothetical protein
LLRNGLNTAIEVRVWWVMGKMDFKKFHSIAKESHLIGYGFAEDMLCWAMVRPMHWKFYA